MLVCKLTSSGGSQCTLPAIRSWDVTRTDGTSLDCFTLTADLPETLLPWLPAATYIRLEWQGATAFTGLVDEYELTLDGSGTGLLLSGRGMGARLLDNQVQARQFVSAYPGDIQQSYVAPYGIASRWERLGGVSNFAVQTGNSCWQVVKGFCAHAGALLPRFTADGIMLVAKTRLEAKQSFYQQGLISAVYRDCRYGVISRQTLIHGKTGAVSVADYPALVRRGGYCQKVGQTSGTVIPAAWRTAGQRIDESRQEEYTLELALPGGFLAEPGTAVEVCLPKLGLEGGFFVREVRSVGSDQGCTCHISLYR